MHTEILIYFSSQQDKEYTSVLSVTKMRSYQWIVRAWKFYASFELGYIFHYLEQSEVSARNQQQNTQVLWGG